MAGILTGVRWWCIVVYDVHVPGDRWCGACFRVPVVTWVSPLEKCVFGSFAAFVIGSMFQLS